ncbi:MAG: exodeoxyribonuclease VII large subunit [Lachnospiraceae bacterium]
MGNTYTVKQVNTYIKNMFTQDYMLNRIYVKGEVSNCKYHTSGHIYFSLKDESGAIACVMFAGQRGGLTFKLSEGQQVIVLGSISTYERDGKYQLYAKEILLDGAGLLYERFEALKKELEDMGMFAPEYKKPIPRYCSKIGIVTAPTGAAIQDIIHIAKRRNPYIQLILYPALVQGTEAAASIVKGIQMLEQTDVDVIIVGRGGGSLEDLWAFNEEIVARAIFDCSIPIISAVGHETDTTIADFVADLRAPTPSAAAELAVYEYMDLKQELNGYMNQLQRLITGKLREAQGKTEQYELKMKYLHPRNKLNNKKQFLMEYENKMKILMSRKLDYKKHQLALYIENMKGLSPLSKLNQGFSFVQDSDSKVINSISNVTIGEHVSIRVTDGSIYAKITGLEQGEDSWKTSN